MSGDTSEELGPAEVEKASRIFLKECRLLGYDVEDRKTCYERYKLIRTAFFVNAGPGIYAGILCPVEDPDSLNVVSASTTDSGGSWKRRVASIDEALDLLYEWVREHSPRGM